MKKTTLLFSMIFLLSGCTSFYMPWATPYESFRNNLGQQYSHNALPPHVWNEVWLGYEERPDGTQLNWVGAGERCVYVFELDKKTRRMTGWRFASKFDPQGCLPRP